MVSSWPPAASRRVHPISANRAKVSAIWSAEPESARRRKPARQRFAARFAFRWISTHRGVSRGLDPRLAVHVSARHAVQRFDVTGSNAARYGFCSAQPACPISRCRRLPVSQDRLPPTAWSTSTRRFYRSATTTASRHWRTEFKRASPSQRLEVAQPDRSLDYVTLFEQHMAVDPRQAACINRRRAPLSVQLDGDVGDR